MGWQAPLAILITLLLACTGGPDRSRAQAPNLQSSVTATPSTVLSRPLTCEELVGREREELRSPEATTFPAAKDPTADDARRRGAAFLGSGSFADAAEQFALAQRGNPTDLTSATLERAAHLAFEESQKETSDRLSLREPVVVADLSLVPSYTTPQKLELRASNDVARPVEPRSSFFFQGRLVSGAEDQPSHFRDAPLTAIHRGADYITPTYGTRWVIVESLTTSRVFDVRKVVPYGTHPQRAVRHKDLVVVEASTGGDAEASFGGLLFAFREETGELVWKSRFRVANIRHFQVAGDYAIVAFSDGRKGGVVSAIDLKTGDTAFEASTTSPIVGLRGASDEILVDTDRGAFSVHLPGVAASALPAVGFVRRTSVQDSMGTTACAVSLLAKALDSRDTKGTRDAIDWLDTLLAPRGLLRAARTAAGALERSATSPNIHGRAPLALLRTTPQSQSAGAGCEPLSFALVWTEGQDEQERAARMDTFGVKSLNGTASGFSFGRPPSHPTAPASFGGEELRSIRRRGGVETLLYGDRYIVVLGPEGLIASFDTGHSSYSPSGTPESLLGALVVGDVLVLSTASRIQDRGALSGFHLRTGELRWTRKTHAHPLESVDGRVLAVGNDRGRGHLVVICPSDGTEVARSSHGKDANDLVVFGNRVLVRKNEVALELEVR